MYLVREKIEGQLRVLTCAIEASGDGVQKGVLGGKEASAGGHLGEKMPGPSVDAKRTPHHGLPRPFPAGPNAHGRRGGVEDGALPLGVREWAFGSLISPNGNFFLFSLFFSFDQAVIKNSPFTC